MTEPELLLLIRGKQLESDRKSSIQSVAVPPEPSLRQLLEELLERHYDWLRRMCMLEFRYSNEAEDCLQEVLIEVAKSIRTFDARSELKTWLFVIAKRTMYRFRKKARVQEQRFPLGKKEDVSERDSPDVHIEHSEKLLSEQERNQKLIGFIRALPEKQRWAVFFHYFEDLSLDDTAKRLGCSVGSVKKHLFRGRQKIKELLESESAA